MRRRRRGILAAALACALALTGCAGKPPQDTGPEPVTIVNDGRPAALVMGEVLVDAVRTETLREMAEKYQADYPQTEIRLRTFDSPEALREALEAGEIQIADVTDRELIGLVRDGLLMDLAEYLPGWSEYATLIPIAQRACGSVSSATAYLLPSDATQDVLYYRADWFAQYNEGREAADMIYCRTWDQIAKAAEALGDRGKIAFAGGDRLPDLFDAMLWSSTTLGRTLDPAMAYFYPSNPVTTLFPQEKAGEGMEQFARILREAALPQALTATPQEALAAFENGEACFLLADRSVRPALAEALPEGAWETMEYPRGLSGTAAFAPDSFRGWAVAADAADWEVAFHFLTFLTGADCNTHYAKVCGTLPLHSTATVLEPSFLNGDLAPELAMVKRPDWYQYALEPMLYQAWDGYRELADEWLRDYLAGSLPQEELLNRLDGFWRYALDTEGPLWK